jgi:Glycosyl transferases group 1
MSNTVHVIGIAHTVPHEDYLVCAFTTKVLLFPSIIQPFGWHVVEYSNEGSVSGAHEHITILTTERLKALSKRTSRDQSPDLDVGNKELADEFHRTLLERIKARAQPGDIVCHVWGPNMDVYNALPNCHHVESAVGYTASPGLHFRIYETSAWMHWHYGKAGQEDGHNYKWVIPPAFETEQWRYCDDVGDYAVFLGRVTQRKGINILAEIARRMPELPIHVYGPGDTSQWANNAPPNLMFKGTVLGRERVEAVRHARCMLMPTVFIEPFGNSGIEAQLCGVPLIGSNFGAFTETVIEGVSGYRCNTLADWVKAIKLSMSLDRREISRRAHEKYSKHAIGKQYDWVFRQLADLSGRGWYGETSRKFADFAVPTVVRSDKPRIWLFIPYFGTLPNYFQLYLDSLARNFEFLSVFFMTDIDLSKYRVPENLIVIPFSFNELRNRAALFIRDEFGIAVEANALLKQPYKLVDFKILYPRLFSDILDKYDVSQSDFIGWGDCDLIYGRFSDFLDMSGDFEIIGGYHGHIAIRTRLRIFSNPWRSCQRSCSTTQPTSLTRLRFDPRLWLISRPTS